MFRRNSLAVFAVTIATMVVGPSVVTAAAADRVLTNGVIETMNPSQPVAEAIAISDGKIVYVGDSAGIKEHIDANTDVIDLEGLYVTPGLIDSHTHVIAANFTVSGLNVEAAQTIEEMAAMIKEYADANPDLKVVQAVNYRTAALGRNPTAADMDKIGLDRPLVVLGNSSHDAVFNTIALKQAGVTNDVKDKAPGVVFWERDSNGDITGAAIETQWMQPFVDIGAWDPKTMVPETIEVMQGFLSSQGVTSVLVPGLITPNFGISSEGTRKDFEDILPILAERAESGEAKMRINVMPFMKLLDASPEDYVPFAIKMREKYNSDMLRVDGLKLHADGHYAQRAMAMLEPYNMTKDDVRPFVAPLTMNSDLIHETIMKATAEDLTVVIHSDGTKINDVATSAIIASKKAFPDAKSRHRLDHVTFLDPDTVERIKKYDIHLNATPVFYNAVENGQDGSAVLEAFSAALIARSMGMYTDLIHENVSVSMGGDPPGSLVTEAYPVWLFQQAMTLQQPGRSELRPFPPMRKRLTIDQALKSMTMIPAKQMGMEDKIGSIKVGKYADLAVFNRNLQEVPPGELVNNVRVLLTYLNGEPVWDGRKLTEEQWSKLMKTGKL